MLNLAVIGCGNMASGLVRHSLQMGRARIAAIHDIDPAALAAKSAEFDAEPVADVRGLLGRSDIDAFLVGSPPLYHHENVLAVAAEGKPIYSEKPLCTTAALCDEMIDACRRHGSKLFVGQVLRLFPLFQKAREVIDSGVVGAPRAVSIQRTGRALHFLGNWRASLAISGGPILETDSHELDYMLSLLGEPTTVYAQGTNVNGAGDYPDTFFVQVGFKSGAFGFLYGGNADSIGAFRTTIQCAKGTIAHDGFNGDLRYRAFDAEEAVVIPRSDLNDRPDPYVQELTSFFDWIEKDTPPLFTGETGRANVAVADAAYRSMASGQVEKV